MGDTDDWPEANPHADVPVEPLHTSCTAPESSFEAALAALASLHRQEVQRLEASAAGLLSKLAELQESTSCGKEAIGESHASKEGIQSIDHIAVCEVPPEPPTQVSVLVFFPQTKGPYKSDVAGRLEPIGSALDSDDPPLKEGTNSSLHSGKEILEVMSCSEEMEADPQENEDEGTKAVIVDWGTRQSDFRTEQGWGGGAFADPELPPRTGIILDTVSASVVVINALTIGVSSDVCEKCLEWEVLEFMFLSFYVSEALFKTIFLGPATYLCGKDKYWNWFDILVIFSSFADIVVSYIILPLVASGQALDIDGLMMMKLFRMFRIFRIIRTLRFEFFKELKMMILGVYSGLRSLFWAIVLLVVIAFVLGVAARMFYSEHPEFSSVDAAMFTLFRCFTDGCDSYQGTPLPERLKGDNVFIIVVVYIFLTMIVTVGLFNLIMATFIDNVNSANDEKRQLELGNTADDVLHQLKHALVELEEEGFTGRLTRVTRKKRNSLTSLTTGRKSKVESPEQIAASTFDARFSRLAEGQFCVTRAKWKQWLARPDFQTLLKEADISASNKMELFDALDADGGGELNIEELLYGLMRLRGPVAKSEIVAIRVKISYMCNLLQQLHAWSSAKMRALD